MNLNSLYPNERYVVLDTVQASGADLAVANSYLSVGNPLVPICKFKDIQSAKIQAAVAEQLQVTTLTPTNAANSTYAFIIQQYNPSTGNYDTFYFSYTTPASGSTATTIGDQFRTAINNNPLIHIAATGTTTLILTAEAGYPIFVVSITETGGGLTQSTGTAGIVAVNTLAKLATQGITVTNASYTSVTMNFTPTTGNLIKNPVKVDSAFTVYINQGDADYSDLVTAFTQALGNLVIGGSTASIEGFALV